MERQHGVPHLSDAPDRVPRQPRIHVQIRDLDDGGVGVEWDVRACDDFQLDPGRWQRLRPGLLLPS